MKQIIYKVPAGKLLKIKCEVTDGVVNNFELRGDFFMYPEAALQELEQFVIGRILDENFVGELGAFIERNEINLFGFAPQDIYDALTQPE